MTTAHEDFWNHSSFAIVAHSARKPFPKLSYRELKKQGRKVFPVDPSMGFLSGGGGGPIAANDGLVVDPRGLFVYVSDSTANVVRTYDLTIFG